MSAAAGSGRTAGRQAWLTLLRPVLTGHRREQLALVRWSVLEAVPSVVSGALVATAVDRGFLAGNLSWGMGALLVYGATLVTGAWATRRSMAPTATLVESVRDHLVRAVVRGELYRGVADDRPVAGDGVAILVRQVETVRQIVAALLGVLRSVLFTLVATIVGLFALVPQIVPAVLVAVLATGIAMRYVALWWRRRHQSVLAAEEALGSHAGQVFGALRDVVACGAQRRAVADLDARADAHALAQFRLADVAACRTGAVALGGRVPLLVLLLLTPWLVTDGALSPGEVLGAATYLITGLEPALRVLVESVGNLGLELGALLRRLADAATLPERSFAGTEQCTGSEVELERVTFRYGESSEPVLQTVSLWIVAGEHLAVVGPSGAGKSTLAAVLAGLRVPESGTVRLGGRAVSSLDEGSLRRMVALVPQEAYVFAGTLRENLGYLAPDASDSEISAAAEAVGAGALLEELGGPGGVVSNPEELTPGQRQHLVLVRLHLSPARIVVLDEATCHLDAHTEAIVERAFAQRPGTLIVIAHRISSARRAGRILVLDSAVALMGSHDDLLAASSTYASLVGHWEDDGTGREPTAVTGPLHE